jgi:hypothetical protein
MSLSRGWRKEEIRGVVISYGTSLDLQVDGGWEEGAKGKLAVGWFGIQQREYDFYNNG